MSYRRDSLLVWLTLVVLTLLASPAALQADDADKKAEAAAKKVAQQQEDAEYYELLKLFADTIDQVDRNYVKEMSRRELMEAAIEGVIRKLDPYSNYIPPQELDRFRSGVENEFGGIGIQVTVQNGQLKVTSPIVGTPAYRAGVLAGDLITKIEGKGTKGITLDGAVKALKGKIGTKVTFTVRHAHNDEEETVTVARAIIRVDSVLGDRRKEDDSWDFMFDTERKIGYLRITSFARHTTEDMRAALRELETQGMRGLIVDVRFNPGGLLTAAIEICDMFVEEGLIVSTKGRNTPENARYAHKTGTYLGFPMAVLVNRYSASASEIFSACLQDHERAVVVGERTWGKGSVQNIINLEGGKSALKLTTASYHRPSGKNIHKFDGAKPEDEWGVRPSEGFQLRLNDVEMGDLVENRRLKDIVLGKADGDLPDAKAIDRFVDKQFQAGFNYILEQLGEKSAAATEVATEDPRQAVPTPPQP